MTDEVPRPQRGFDPERPSPARIYDAFLGGTHNFASDRAVAEQAIAVLPKLPDIMRANRAFLQRAVRCAAASGIDQFVDLGSGIPTAGNVHEVAREGNPAARVVYVDVDPVAVLHSQSILDDDPQGSANTVVLQADLRDPKRIIGDPAVRGLIDFDRDGGPGAGSTARRAGGPAAHRCGHAGHSRQGTGAAARADPGAVHVRVRPAGAGLAGHPRPGCGTAGEAFRQV
jgi:hypothetical protein